MLEEDLKTIKNCELDIELLNRKNELLCNENNSEITKLRNKIILTESIIEEELKKSGEDKIECKLGSASFKKMPDEWIYTDELMAWINSLPEKLKELYLKVVTTVKKGDLKKQIIAYNDMLFEKSIFLEKWSEDVELFLHTEEKDFKVKGIEIKRQDPKFSYTIKKK